MNFTVPPSLDDMLVIAGATLDILPEELAEFCDTLTVEVEDFPCEVVEQEQDLDDPYELCVLYKSGREISPGVERKTANDDDVLVLYRRPILDLWCEECDDLSVIIRSIIVEELGRNFDFSDEEIDEMNERHYQGML
ncbi:MAG: metallopeptidase family protein [Pseudomonadota bacterium]